jgi:hypothetical protein
MKKKNYVFKKDTEGAVAKFYFGLTAILYCWFLNKCDKSSNYFVARLIK